MSQQPNIIFIMADDHAARAISCYGAGINETPNIDRLAKEGIRLNHCYVTNSICTPSRAAILTGTYNHVNCVFTLQTPINNRMPNVAKHLKTGTTRLQSLVNGIWARERNTNPLDSIFGQCYQGRENILILT